MIIISRIDNMMTVLIITSMTIWLTMTVFLVVMTMLVRMTMSCIMIYMALVDVGYIVLLGALSTLMCRTGVKTEGLMCHTGVMMQDIISKE